MRFFVLSLSLLIACDPADPGTDATSGVDATSDATDATDATSDTTDTTGDVLPNERTIAFSPVAADNLVYRYLFAHDGALYAQAGTNLVRSSDGARTWGVRGPFAGDRAMLSDGTRIYAQSSHGLFLSEDDGATFQEKTDVFALEPGPNLPYYQWQDVGGGAWWVATNDGRLARSLDFGETFDVVTAPAMSDSAVRIHAGADGNLYFIASQKLYRTSLAGPIAWDPIDPGSIVNSVWVSAGGSIFVSTYLEQRTRFLRKPPDSDEWIDLGSENEAFTFLQDGSDIVRIGNGFAVTVSHDDGLTWEPRGERYAASTAIWGWVAKAGEVLAASDLGFLRLAVGVSTWTLEDAGNLPPPGYANFRDIAFSTSGRIAVLGEKQVFVSDDDGATWRRSVEFDARFTCIAMKPDGSRIFVGAGQGRFWLLNGEDVSLIAERTLPLSQETIRQATWVGNGSENIFLVATASDDDTAGVLLYSTILGDDDNGFFELNPSRSESNPQLRYTQGYHAVAMHGPWLHVLFRRWFGTNSWQPFYRYNYDFFGTDSWLDDEPAVAFSAPRSITLTHTERPTPIIVYGNDEMYFGSQKVIADGLFQPPFSAKLDYRERLWVIAGNVYRSSAPLTF